MVKITEIKESVIANLNADRKAWPKIAIESGVSIHSINKMADRRTNNPGVDNVEAIYNYFELNPVVPEQD